MKIGQLGVKAGVSAKTIRYYEGIGLLPEPPRSASGYRDYDGKAFQRLQFIRAAQSIGLSLGEVREVLGLRDRGQPACAHVTRLIDQHAKEIRERIRALQEMQDDLIRLARRARRLGAQGAANGTYCHIIKAGAPRHH